MTNEESITKGREDDDGIRHCSEESENVASQEPDDVFKVLKKEVENADDAEAQQEKNSQDLESIADQSADSEAVPDSEKTPSIVLKPPSQKEADFTNPIPLSNQTVITVNGKKCVLQYDAKTQQVCAYPIKTKSE